MTVRKKVVVTISNRDRIDLSQELIRVREAIIHLPTDEGVVMNETSTTTSPEATPSSPVTPKKASKKATKKAVAKTQRVVKLTDICRGLKIQPRLARRVLRDKKVKNPGRWAWLQGSTEMARITSLLKK